MFSFLSIASSAIQKLGRAKGDSVVAIASGDAERGYDAEYYATHGIVSRPSKATKGIRIRLGSLSIIIASYTYGIDPPQNEGAVKLYSTDLDGAEQATHLLDDDGTHVINGGTIEAARNGDSVQSTAVEDAAFWTWVSTISAAVNALAPGSVPSIPTSAAGKITSGTSEVLLP